MDPLSVAGSIAGLISLSDMIFRKLYHYVKDVKNAEKEIRTLKNEVASLNGVLHNIYLIAQDLEADEAQDHSLRLSHVSACLATLYELDDTLNKMDLPNKGRVHAAIQKFKWPFKADECEEFIESIRHHRNNLNFALSAESLSALLQCLSKQDELLQGFRSLEAEFRGKAQIETRFALSKERDNILNCFLHVNSEEAFRTTLRLRYPTTGIWLTENISFKKWLRGSNVHLWLNGISGAGKTVLSGLVIQRCMALTTAKRAVAFFYCDYRDKHSQDIVNILSSIATQLARQRDDVFQKLEDLHTALSDQNQLQRKPEEEELVSMLQEMFKSFDDVRIIVDGIDECGDHAGDVSRALKSLAIDHANDVSRALNSLRSGHKNVSLCMLSRDEADIREVLQQSMFDHIEISAHTKDVDHYVRSEIEDRIKKGMLRLRTNKLKEEIVHQLATRAEGMSVSR
jgi:hypothetical protein